MIEIDGEKLRIQICRKEMQRYSSFDLTEISNDYLNGYLEGYTHGSADTTELIVNMLEKLLEGKNGVI